ncbi:hypothetical protein F5X71_07550 [Nocardia brasiliensis]|uniref:Uncharacterized protein n=1 Tax=Nocardia brasiliensis TaxID=37326 RepID=A0A6G9XMQ0_NOCBR|nr:hypothetical protein [Nocardia brasiliensis]QIS02194.1 hypothetical protein F5X71_07550 [Nocardia brasiliensis]
MTSSSLGNVELRITDEQITAFYDAVEFWREQYIAKGWKFPWFMPMRRSENRVIAGIYDEMAFRIESVPNGYNLVQSLPREGEQEPSFFSRYEDAVKKVAYAISFMYRSDADLNPLFNWRHNLAAGVVRQDIGDGWAKYYLIEDPEVYHIGGYITGVAFSRALTMSIDEFNEAMLDDPGEPAT